MTIANEITTHVFTTPKELRALADMWEHGMKHFRIGEDTASHMVDKVQGIKFVPDQTEYEKFKKGLENNWL